MASITSGVGLISGLNIQSLVDQLIAVDARPRDLLVARVGQIDAQRTAYADITARFMALLGRIGTLATASSFRTSHTTSSNADVLSASASETAPLGNYTFRVRSLATSHQLLSSGFDSRSAPLPNGTITIESAQARVDRATALAELNGHRGIQRGRFEITNGAGVHANIDIADARTISDVIQRINDSPLNVSATLTDSGIVLTDDSGGAGGLRIRELDGGHTAADLGFGVGNQFAGGANAALTGTNLVYMTDATPLDSLNDGLGVRTARAGGDFSLAFTDGTHLTVDMSEILQDSTRLGRLNSGHGVNLGTIRITSRDRTSHEVDLSGATTIGDVKARIEQQAPGTTVVLTAGKLVIRDSSGATDGPLKIEDVTGTSAHDLGIDSLVDSATLTGRPVLFMRTVGDALRAINLAAGNDPPRVNASISADGRHLELRDGAGNAFADNVEITADEHSHALADLGFTVGTQQNVIAGSRRIGGLNTVLLNTLNGGRGVTAGTIHIADGATATDVDLHGVETLQEAVDRINSTASSAGLAIQATFDSTGTRLLVQRTAGTGDITISDVDGDFAQIAGLTQSGERVRGADLQRQYINERTRLDQLNNGAGISRGTIRITSSGGATHTFDLSQSNFSTLDDVIRAVNDEHMGVTASINATGDGLLLTDSAHGAVPMKVEDVGGNAARDLNILGETRTGSIDGSFEFQVSTSGGDTLDSLIAKINHGTLARAEVVNDGSSTNPYRLSITSRASGIAGTLLVDTGDTGIDLQTLTRPQDATIVFGEAGSAGVAISSSSNTFRDVVSGLTLTANSVSDQPVTVNVGRDVDSLVQTFQGLVTDFNTLVDRVKDLSSYNADTQQAGMLLGENALQTARSRLYSVLQQSFGSDAALRRLSQVGLRVSSGAHLSFDEQAFRDAYAANPEGVTQFFTDTTRGAAVKLQTELQAITDRQGILSRRSNSLQDEKDLLNARVDSLNDQLDRKRQRLLRQFQAMEEALARIQSQGAALNGFTSSMPSIGGSRSGS